MRTRRHRRRRDPVSVPETCEPSSSCRRTACERSRTKPTVLRRQFQRLRFCVRADRQRQQLLLRAGVLSSLEQARRQVPSDRSADVASGPESARPPRLCGAEGKSTGAACCDEQRRGLPAVLRALNSPLPRPESRCGCSPRLQGTRRMRRSSWGSSCVAAI